MTANAFHNITQVEATRLGVEAAAVDVALTAFEALLAASRTPLAALVDSVKGFKALPQDKRQGLADAMAEWTSAASDEAAEFFDRRATGKVTKQIDEERKSAVDQLKDCAYLHRQVIWLQDRFPQAEMADVPGLCKVVTRAEIEAADWSLTPGRFVGVAPAEVDEDFDFEQTLRDIHLELADLNRESVDLALKIQTNFEELGV